MSNYVRHSVESTNLADVLERVLDKGIVIAGDITISLVDIELLSLKVRLLISSVDKAQEIGINWWAHDPYLSGDSRKLAQENQELRARLTRLEEQLTSLSQNYE
ncbi:MAG: gas vesicle protein [Chloroflexota bacterium]